METINIQENFSSLNQLWHPHQIAKIDDMQIVLVKMKGELNTWFNHGDEDKCLQVIKGTLEIHFKDKIEFVKKGEMIVIPKGTEYTPKAKEEIHSLVFEKLTPLHY